MTTIVKLLLREIAEIFPSPKIHIGFDEVDYRCWNVYPSFKTWKTENRLTNRAALRQFFLNVTAELTTLNKSWIVWQDSIEMLESLPKASVIQAWKCWKEPWTHDELLGRFIGRLAARQGYTVVEST